MNLGEQLTLNAETRLRARFASTGTIEQDGVPKIVQQMTFSYSLFAFIVLLFNEEIFLVPAEYTTLDLMDMAEQHHYIQAERHVLRLAKEGVFQC